MLINTQAVYLDRTLLDIYNIMVCFISFIRHTGLD